MRKLILLAALAPAACLGQMGSIDNVSCTTIYGWAIGANLADTQTVTVYSDGTEVGTAVAGLNRSDVQAVYGGSGNYGYDFPTPPAIIDGHAHTISIKPGNVSLPSSGTPLTVTCQPGAAYYTYAEDASFSGGQISDPSHWNYNAGSSDIGSFSYIWNQLPSNWNNEYEIRTNLTLSGNGGVFQQYLRADSNAVSSWEHITGTMFLMELQSPTFTTAARHGHVFGDAGGL